MIQFLRRLLEAIPYFLAIPVDLMVPLWVIGIPGRASTLQLIWFLASFTAMLAYPVAIFVIVIERVKAWRAGGPVRIPYVRAVPFAALALLLLIQSPIVYSVYADWRRSALRWDAASPEERMMSAIQRGDTDRRAKVLHGGFDVDRPLFFESSAALLSAERGDWEFVEILLEHGANPDRPNERGETLRSEFEDFLTRTHPHQEEALERVRALLKRSARTRP